MKRILFSSQIIQGPWASAIYPCRCPYILAVQIEGAGHIIRRSFSEYLAKWLLDAGREYGCRIEQECAFSFCFQQIFCNFPEFRIRFTIPP